LIAVVDNQLYRDASKGKPGGAQAREESQHCRACAGWAKVAFILCTRRKLLPSSKQEWCAEGGHTIHYSGATAWSADSKKICKVCYAGKETER
jgi:hypothetical protein